MKRRRFIAGLGAVSIGWAGTIGTGAVSSTTADRSLQVTIATDSSGATTSGAYLSIEDTSRVAVQNYQRGTVVLDYTRLNEFSSGEGFNPGSIYEITGGYTGVLTIRNQSDRPIEIAAITADSIDEVRPLDDPASLDTSVADEGPVIELFDTDDSDREAITDDNPYPLRIGESVPVGTRVIVPEGIGPDTYEQSLLLQGREQ